MRSAFIPFLLMCLAPSLWAQLKFDQNPLELRPNPADETVTAAFSFTNTSTSVIELGEIDTSCSCLEASTNQTRYQPGESGTGTATFKISSFMGRQQKYVYLPFKNSDQPRAELTVVIDIPRVIDITPKRLEWVVGEKPIAKKLTVLMKADEPIHITELESTREFIDYQLVTVEKGRHYEIILQPKSTEKSGIGALKILTDSPVRKFSRQMAFYNILTPELAAKKAAAREKKAAEAE